MRGRALPLLAALAVAAASHPLECMAPGATRAITEARRRLEAASKALEEAQ